MVWYVQYHTHSSLTHHLIFLCLGVKTFYEDKVDLPPFFVAACEIGGFVPIIGNRGRRGKEERERWKGRDFKREKELVSQLLFIVLDQGKYPIIKEEDIVSEMKRKSLAEEEYQEIIRSILIKTINQ